MAIVFSHTKLGLALLASTLLLSCAASARADPVANGSGGVAIAAPSSLTTPPDPVGGNATATPTIGGSGAQSADPSQSAPGTNAPVGTPPPSAAAPAASGATPSESSATTQALWQIQISGCTAHCRGTRQTQVGLQQNATTQAGGPTESVGGKGPPARGDKHLSDRSPARGDTHMGDRSPALGDTHMSATAPRHKRRVTQIQLGCISHCFGGTSTTRSSAGTRKRVIDQLLGLSKPPALRVIEPAPATEQSAVGQTSVQVQEGTPSTTMQSQGAVQSNTTSQRSPGAVSDAVTGVAQGIWQLQIGCLTWCVNTHQLQRAGQVSTTTRLPSQVVGARQVSSGVSVDDTNQRIWQVQIGCVAWCYDATEQQSASQTDAAVRVRATPVSPPASPEPSGRRRGSGGETSSTSGKTPATTTAAPPAARPSETPASSRNHPVAVRAVSVPIHPERTRPAMQDRGISSASEAAIAQGWRMPFSRATARPATGRRPGTTIVTEILALVAAFAVTFAAFWPRPRSIRRGSPRSISKP